MNTRLLRIAIGLSLLVGRHGVAEDRAYPKALVSFEDFKAVMAEVESIRPGRLVDLNTFLAMSKEPDTMILDARSASRFERVHIKGAKHLAFTDFTQENLAKVIPGKDTKILIYCNNNFRGDPVDFASKVVVLPNPQSAKDAGGVRRIAAQEKARSLALNVPTHITLYGYGYHNVYELDELVGVDDARVPFEGSLSSKQRALQFARRGFPVTK